MNLSNYVSVTASYASSGATTGGSTGGAGGTGYGSTGDPVAVSTSGFTGATSSPGGYPFATTSIDMAGYEGVFAVANYASVTTGGGAGTSGWFTLQYGTIAGATASSTTFVPLQGAYNIAYSTQPNALGLDVYRPSLGTNLRNRYGAFVLQVPSSSAVAYSINAFRYGAKYEGVAKGTTANSSGGLSSFFAGFAVSVSAGT